MRYTYLIIDISAVIVPLIASFHPRIKYYRQWLTAILSMLISGIVFILWDIYFTRAGVWGFNPDYLLGNYLSGLPVEEVLFFLCIPYACMFSYHCLLTLWPCITVPATAATCISWILIAGGLITAIVFHTNRYTCATFTLLALFILYAKRKSWIGHFYLCYGIMLLPFVIINGILTGSWIAAPIVWYNNHEIIGLRLLTIPVEDVFYGLILIGSQVALYELFAARVARYSLR
jgi:lycopene cyclase domain-containing protein